jgi:FkbM family methyltransferase
MSFAQSGEDLIANFIFDYLKIVDISYLDVGAYDPVRINNTYYFYRKGFRGVLVEPNVTMCEKLRAVRPRDTTLNAGIGVTAVREANYYLMTEPSWNTFSREEADHQAKVTNGRIKIEKVIKMPLLNINDVMREHLKGAPTFLSIDAEGWHLPILKSIDYTGFRPKVICVETLVSGTTTVIAEVASFMTSQGYHARGGSIVNTLFVDGKLLGT